MTKGKTRFNVVLTVAFAALCLGGLGYISLNMGLNGPWNNDFRLEAQFDSANGLVPQAEVRVSGVHVGTVVSIGDSSDGGATVRMNLQPGIQLRQDTRAVIRPKTLLGEKFVELVRQQGSSLAYLPSGASIPKSQTGQAVEIDDILNAMDAPTRKAMSESFRELGTDAEPGSALVTLSGAVSLPGVYEVGLGMPIRELIEWAGGTAEPEPAAPAPAEPGPEAPSVPEE